MLCARVLISSIVVTNFSTRYTGRKVKFHLVVEIFFISKKSLSSSKSLSQRANGRLLSPIFIWGRTNRAIWERSTHPAVSISNFVTLIFVQQNGRTTTQFSKFQRAPKHTYAVKWSIIVFNSTSPYVARAVESSGRIRSDEIPAASRIYDRVNAAPQRQAAQ